MMLLLLNGAYNGIGRSAGSIIGGKLQTMVGTKAVFLYFSVINATLALVLTVYYYVLPRLHGQYFRTAETTAVMESKKQQ
jgi:hypothetical protein